MTSERRGSTTSPVSCDSSVLVAALSTWHPAHAPCLAAARSRVTAVAPHVLTETYATLTRLPSGHRVTPVTALASLKALSYDLLSLPPSRHLALLASLADGGVTGGSAYDGVIAATAAHHGYLLLSLDRRAERTYRAVGVDYELIG